MPVHKRIVHIISTHTHIMYTPVRYMERTQYHNVMLGADNFYSRLHASHYNNSNNDNIR